MSSGARAAAHVIPQPPEIGFQCVELPIVGALNVLQQLPPPGPEFGHQPVDGRGEGGTADARHPQRAAVGGTSGGTVAVHMRPHASEAGRVVRPKVLSGAE